MLYWEDGGDSIWLEPLVVSILVENKVTLVEVVNKPQALIWVKEENQRFWLYVGRSYEGLENQVTTLFQAIEEKNRWEGGI